MSSCILPCLALTEEPVPAASQPATSTQEVPLVWAVVVKRMFDASHMGYSVGGHHEGGVWVIHPLQSGDLGVFVAQSPVPDKDKQRLVFIDDNGARHVANCGGWSYTDSVCITFYRTTKSCPLKNVREVRLERQVPETDPS